MARTKAVHELTPIELLVWHAACRLDRRGTFPSAERLVDVCEDVGERDVRRAHLNLKSWGFLESVTSDDSPEGHVEPSPHEFHEPTVPYVPSQPHPLGIDTSSRPYNLALWRVVDGRGNRIRALSVLTGLSECAITKRCQKIRHNHAPKEADEAGEGLTIDERRAVAHQYRKSTDPAVREFLDRVTTADRAHPDRRDSPAKLRTRSRAKKTG